MNMEVLHQRLIDKLAKLPPEEDAKMSPQQNFEMRDIMKRSEALSDVLASMRSSEQEVLKSTCRIPLPIQVSRKIHKIELLGSQDGTRIIDIDLKAEESTYRAMQSAVLELVD